MSHNVSLQTIRAAASNIKGFATRTPVVTSTTLNRKSGLDLHFKSELFQKTGSFKFRGMYNAAHGHRLSVEKHLPVVIHSSGNAGQALALASKMNLIKCHVVMPRTSPPAKQAATRSYSGLITLCDPSERSRIEAKDKIVAETGAKFISSSNNVDVISGAGTIGLELLEDIPDLEAVVVPVSGGGLLSGIALAIKSMKPDCLVFGAEPLNADDCYQSKKAGKLVKPVQPPVSIADSLLMPLGDLTWPIIRDFVDEVLLVEEKEIIESTLLVWQRMKLTIEPGSGVAVAAVTSDRFRQLLRGRRKVAVILSGGNVDVSKLIDHF